MDRAAGTPEPEAGGTLTPLRRSELVDRGLIYDVGVNDGSDSAYYLSLGFRVLGIEANPALANRLKDRFAREIEEQRYILLNVGIAATEDQLDFWVQDDTARESISGKRHRQSGKYS